MGVVATDDFNRANGSAGSNWSTQSSYTILTITSNKIQSVAGVDYAGTYNAANAGTDDMYAKIDVTVGTSNGTEDVIVACRLTNDGNETGYFGDDPSYASVIWTLSRATNSAFTTLATGGAGASTVGTRSLEIRAIGTTISLRVAGSQVASVTDSTHSGASKRFGGCHVYSDNTNDCSLDNFEMGNFLTTAPPPPRRSMRNLMRRS